MISPELLCQLRQARSRLFEIEFFLFPVFNYLLKLAFSEGFNKFKKIQKLYCFKTFFSFDDVFLLIGGIVTCKLCYLGFVEVHEAFKKFGFSDFNIFSFFAKSLNSCLSSFFIKTHKTPWPLGLGGIFSHFAIEVLGVQ